MVYLNHFIQSNYIVFESNTERRFSYLKWDVYRIMKICSIINRLMYL